MKILSGEVVVLILLVVCLVLLCILACVVKHVDFMGFYLCPKPIKLSTLNAGFLCFWFYFFAIGCITSTTKQTPKKTASSAPRFGMSAFQR